MNASDLKYHYQQQNPNGHYFDRASMKFFGDSMGNYGCRDAGSHWELWRKRPNKLKLQGSVFFDKVTFAYTSTDPRTDTREIKEAVA